MGKREILFDGNSWLLVLDGKPIDSTRLISKKNRWIKIHGVSVRKTGRKI